LALALPHELGKFALPLCPRVKALVGLPPPLLAELLVVVLPVG